MSKRLVLVRLSDDGKLSLGRLYVFDGLEMIYHCCTLEPAWKANERQVSCVPWGRYTVRQRVSNKYGKHFHLIDVANRDWVLIHSGNFRRDTTGCILVGATFSDIDGDGLPDVTSSRQTMRLLLAAIGDVKEIIMDVCA